MRSIHWRRLVLLLAVLAWAGCATTRSSTFDEPATQVPQEDQLLFGKALEHQRVGRLDMAADSWRKYLDKYPKSYEARNNLGMTLYSKDQLLPAIQEFEKAHDLEPKNERIAANLADALKYQTTLYKDSREFDKALSNLRRIVELTPGQREKLKIEMERLHDRIFEQYKSADTIEGYKEYVETYPDSPNIAEARKRIERLEKSGATEMAGVGAFPDSKAEPLETGSVTEEEAAKGGPEAIQLPPIPQLGMPEVEKAPAEAAPPPAPVEKVLPPPTPAAETKKPEPAAKKDEAKKGDAKKSTGKLKVVTKGKPLAVHNGPDKKAKTIGSVKNGAVVTALEEKNGWVHIQFGKSKGWVNKNFVKPVQ